MMRGAVYEIKLILIEISACALNSHNKWQRRYEKKKRVNRIWCCKELRQRHCFTCVILSWLSFLPRFLLCCSKGERCTLEIECKMRCLMPVPCVNGAPFRTLNRKQPITSYSAQIIYQNRHITHFRSHNRLETIDLSVAVWFWLLCEIDNDQRIWLHLQHTCERQALSNTCFTILLLLPIFFCLFLLLLLLLTFKGKQTAINLRRMHMQVVVYKLQQINLGNQTFFFAGAKLNETST